MGNTLASTVIIDRGGCLFLEKVFNAQYANADAVIVVDNIEQNLIEMVLPDNPDEWLTNLQQVRI